MAVLDRLGLIAAGEVVVARVVQHPRAVFIAPRLTSKMD